MGVQQENSPQENIPQEKDAEPSDRPRSTSKAN